MSESLKNKISLVTGASRGIGAAIAIELAKCGASVIGTATSEKGAEIIKKSFEINKVKGQAMVLDVNSNASIETLMDKINEEFGTVDILINNAGNAHGLDSIESGSSDDWDAMIDINVKGLLYVSKAIIPQMIAKGSGHIINIGSTAGKEVYPNGNVYCASKYAVDAINQGMRLDLNGKGIKVGAINPGLVETEFSEVRFKGDTQRASKVYQNFTPLQPQDIADVIYFAITRPPHVNIADLTVMCLDQASSTIVNKQ